MSNLQRGIELQDVGNLENQATANITVGDSIQGNGDTLLSCSTQYQIFVTLMVQGIAMTERVELETVQRHEDSTESNIRIGEYKMPPAEEFEFFRYSLEMNEISRLILPNDYGKFTQHTCLLDQVDATIDKDNRTISFINDKIDLRTRDDLAVIIASTARDHGPLVILDGGHRLCAHYSSFGSVNLVRCFVCIHPMILEWGQNHNFSQGIRRWYEKYTIM